MTLPMTRARSSELGDLHIAAPIRSTASSRSPTRTTRPPHSAIVSSAPAGSSPSRTGITANMVRATLRDDDVTISARAGVAAASASRFDARLARRWRTTSIVTVSVNAAAKASRKALV